MATTHVRRTPEQVVADLQAKIAAVKDRESRKIAEKEPHIKSMIAAARALKRARLDARNVLDDPALSDALDRSIAPIRDYALERGLALPPDPKQRKPRKPREPKLVPSDVPVETAQAPELPPQPRKPKPAAAGAPK